MAMASMCNRYTYNLHISPMVLLGLQFHNVLLHNLTNPWATGLIGRILKYLAGAAQSYSEKNIIHNL
jgi:hypothetical protein